MLPSGSPSASARITRLVPPWAITAMRRPACRSTTPRRAGTARAWRSATLSPSGNGIAKGSASQRSHSSGSRARISAKVSPSQRPIAISRSGGTASTLRPAGGGQRRRRLPGADGDRSRRRPRSARPRGAPQRHRLRQAHRGQGDVRVPEEASLRRVEHLAVAGEVDPRRRHQTSSRKSRLTARVRTPASIVSTSAPSVSPVNPPSRRRR